MSRLSFEVAKALKDAGWSFPDVPPYGEWDITKMGPSLSELIEKCPSPRYDKLSFVLRGPDHEPLWEACYTSYADASYDVSQGATPEEAVANLILLGVKEGWIKL